MTLLLLNLRPRRRRTTSTSRAGGARLSHPVPPRSAAYSPPGAPAPLHLSRRRSLRQPLHRHQDDRCELNSFLDDDDGYEQVDSHDDGATRRRSVDDDVELANANAINY